jgi:hypothetical protein
MIAAMFLAEFPDIPSVQLTDLLAEPLLQEVLDLSQMALSSAVS